MVDATRVHERVEKRDFPGIRLSIEGLFPKSVEVFVPEALADSDRLPLLIHFLGAAHVPIHAVSAGSTSSALAAVHLGAGSAINEKPFRGDATLFSRLIDSLRQRISERVGRPIQFERIDLSGFSAGYGAIRAILGSDHNLAKIDGVLLLDGLHTSYIPERKPLAEGGKLDTTKLEPFLRLARLAVANEKKFVVTHSEIFPGTFASTTETADYLLEQLGLKRTPVLKWGPGGMQQLSEARKGSFVVLGFAGNTAPDHLDHFHGMYAFLDLLR